MNVSENVYKMVKIGSLIANPTELVTRPVGATFKPRAHGSHSLLMSSRSALASILASASSVGWLSKAVDSAAVMLPMQMRSRRS